MRVDIQRSNKISLKCYYYYNDNDFEAFKLYVSLFFFVFVQGWNFLYVTGVFLKRKKSRRPLGIKGLYGFRFLRWTTIPRQGEVLLLPSFYGN